MIMNFFFALDTNLSLFKRLILIKNDMLVDQSDLESLTPQSV